jgi:hypothetical protein
LSVIGGLLAFQIPASCQVVKPYTGRLNCDTLDQDIAHFSRLLIGRFCRGASEACQIQKMYTKLEANNPLKDTLQDRLQDYLNLQLEICELAFAVHAPEFYEKHFSRTHPNIDMSTSFERTPSVSPTIIE